MAACAAKASQCVCAKLEGHVEAGDEVHACGDVQCGGSWTGTYDGADFIPVTYPGIDSEEDYAITMLALLFGTPIAYAAAEEDDGWHNSKG